MAKTGTGPQKDKDEHLKSVLMKSFRTRTAERTINRTEHTVHNRAKWRREKGKCFDSRR